MKYKTFSHFKEVVEYIIQRPLAANEVSRLENNYHKKTSCDIDEIFNNYTDLLKNLIENHMSIPEPPSHLELRSRPLIF